MVHSEKFFHSEPAVEADKVERALLIVDFEVGNDGFVLFYPDQVLFHVEAPGYQQAEKHEDIEYEAEIAVHSLVEQNVPA